MTSRRYCRPFCLTAFVLLIAAPVAVCAENTPQAAVSDSAKTDAVKPAASAAEQSAQAVGAPADNAGSAAPANQAPQDKPAQPASLTDKAIDKVKQAAKSASDIFNRVPCLPPRAWRERSRCRMSRTSSPRVNR